MTGTYSEGEPVISVGFTRESHEGLRLTILQLKKLARRLNVNQRLWGTIRDDVLIPMIDARFQTNDFGRWKPVTAYALASRQHNVEGNEAILVDSGELWEQAIHKARFRMKGSQLEYNYWPDHRRWAVFHEFGTNWIPARPWGYLERTNIRQIEEIFMDWVDGEIQDSWSDDPSGFANLGRNVRTQAKFGEQLGMFNEYMDFAAKRRAGPSTGFDETVGSFTGATGDPLDD